MNKPMTLNVRVSGALGDFVAANIGEAGSYENVSEYVRDLKHRARRHHRARQVAAGVRHASGTDPAVTAEPQTAVSRLG